MTIGQRIKIRREQLGLSADEVGKRIGKDRATVYRYESETIKNFPLSVLSPLAAALETTDSFLMGWDDSNVSKDVVIFPVVGDIAAGYDHIAIEDWTGDTIEIPSSYLHGRSKFDYFVLRVRGSSMEPEYFDGDEILVLKQPDVDCYGDIGAVLYGENATLKIVKYNPKKKELILEPINNRFESKTFKNSELEQCRILGIPKLLVRKLHKKSW